MGVCAARWCWVLGAVLAGCLPRSGSEPPVAESHRAALVNGAGCATHADCDSGICEDGLCCAVWCGECASCDPTGTSCAVQKPQGTLCSEAPRFADDFESGNAKWSSMVSQTFISTAGPTGKALTMSASGGIYYGWATTIDIDVRGATNPTVELDQNLKWLIYAPGSPGVVTYSLAATPNDTGVGVGIYGGSQTASNWVDNWHHQSISLAGVVGPNTKSIRLEFFLQSYIYAGTQNAFGYWAVDNLVVHSGQPELCAACNAAGSCAQTVADDARCGTIDCDGLDNTCGDFHDLTTNRCGAAGQCKVKNTLGACTLVDPIAAGSNCSTSASPTPCQACDGLGSCSATPVDDDECGAIDCDYLDRTCRDYADLTAARCAGFGTCKAPNTVASCTVYTDLGAAASCAVDPAPTETFETLTGWTATGTFEALGGRAESYQNNDTSTLTLDTPVLVGEGAELKFDAESRWYSATPGSAILQVNDGTAAWTTVATWSTPTGNTPYTVSLAAWANRRVRVRFIHSNTFFAYGYYFGVDNLRFVQKLPSSCALCDGAGTCSGTPSDDSRCGTIDCDGLDVTCRDYQDLTAGRCEGFGDCKEPNSADCTSYVDALPGADCGLCAECNGSGSCLGAADDTACGTVDCDGLDVACRDYSDLTANRCKAIGVCKSANSADCATYANATSGADCGACKECNASGACTETPTDDNDCGVLDCDQLDTLCRDFQDVTTARCSAFGLCKPSNSLATCGSATMLAAGTLCSGGAAWATESFEGGDLSRWTTTYVSATTALWEHTGSYALFASSAVGGDLTLRVPVPMGPAGSLSFYVSAGYQACQGSVQVDVGAGWIPLGTLDRPVSTGYAQQTYSLASYAHEPVRIRFVFNVGYSCLLDTIEIVQNLPAVCAACDGAGSCTSAAVDDSRCGTIDCDTLDTACKNYADLTSARCEAFNDCKDPNTADCTVVTTQPPGTDCATTPAASESFESSTSAWTLTGSWGRTTTQKYDGSYSLTDTPVGNAISPSSTTATLNPTFDLTTMIAPSFEYATRYVIPPGGTAYVEISNDGSAWQTLASYGASTQSTWLVVRLPLTAYKYTTARFRFRLVVGQWNTSDGWYLDAVRVLPSSYAACAACDAAGQCADAPADDARCGAIDCDGLDQPCRDFADLTANRCSALGACKPANDATTCTIITPAAAGTSCGTCRSCDAVGACSGTPADDSACPVLNCNVFDNTCRDYSPQTTNRCLSFGTCKGLSSTYCTSYVNASAGTRCGTCAGCNGGGSCSQALADDSTCGVLDCDGLDSECQDYDDVTQNRCAGMYTCKGANLPSTCTTVATKAVGTLCSGRLSAGDFESLAATNQYFFLSGWTRVAGDGRGDSMGLSDSAADYPAWHYAELGWYPQGKYTPITVHGVAPTLRFWHRYDFEPGKDFGRVIASDANTGEETVLGEYSAGSPQTEWKQESLSLAALVGKTVYLVFRSEADGINQRDGWHLDDLELREADGACNGCDASGACGAVKAADDPACGTIDCDQLDTPCRDYHDIENNRCEAPGDCVDPNTADCTSYTDKTTCDDGNACTVGDSCVAGGCVAGTAALDCNDGNDCTTDGCNPGTGCTHTPLSGAGCNDQSACTTGDVCVAGSCTGTPIGCDDGNACTADACEDATGCVHAPLSVGACDDGSVCTIGDTCSGGVCTGALISCDDGDPCSVESCDAIAGCGYSVTNEGGACATATRCGGTCQAGQCLGGTTLACDDGNPCTVDVCGGGSCVHTPVAKDTPCEDGLVCNGIETCQAGVCTAGSPLPCGMDMTALDLLPVVDLIGPDLSGADLLAPAPVDLAAASADLTAAVDLAAGDAPAGAEDLGGGADLTAAEDLTAGDDLAQAYLDLTSTAAADASEDAAADVDAAAVPADASVVSPDLSVPIGTPKDGCACHVASPRELPGTALLVLFVVLGLRRRARRDGPQA